MDKTYPLWQVIIMGVLIFFLVSAAIFAYDRITNPDGLWCVRYSPDGTEQTLRGADCLKS